MTQVENNVGTKTNLGLLARAKKAFLGILGGAGILAVGVAAANYIIKLDNHAASSVAMIFLMSSTVLAYGVVANRIGAALEKDQDVKADNVEKELETEK